jgi:hypothetical protein
MDESTERKIEIFAPCSAALDLTKLILFQPFDLTKWFVIGFAAFMSHLAGGGGSGFNYNSRLGKTNWNFRSTTHDAFQSATGMPTWVLPLIGFAVLVVVAIVVVLMWLSARGKFIFADCIVRNRGAIEEPWREFKREGNSYFLFSLLATAIVLFVLGLATLPLWIPLALGNDVLEGVRLALGIALAALVMVLLVVPLHLISSFMIPVMYRQRCGATAALRATLRLIAAEPGAVILYLLFTLVLFVAFAMVSCLVTCVTCCIAAIPYLGTVIMLPAYVFFMSYLLLFVRQFGPEYDAWANILAVEPAAPAIEPPNVEPPPVQT